MIRGNIVEFGKTNGKETVLVVVRAASKPGAIIASRLRAASTIPLREQRISEVRNVSNMRLFDQWEIEVQDKKELENVGK